MQPLQYNLRSPAAKINSITNAATAQSNLDAAITMRSAETELQNTKELTTRNGVGNCSSKTGSRHQSEKKTILKHFLKGFLEGESLAPKWSKSADKSLSQPSCSHSNTIYEAQLQKTNAATARSNLDAAITMRSAETELQNTKELPTRNGVGNCSSKTGSRHQSEKKTILKHFLKGFLEGKSLAPKWRKSADKSLWQPSCSHSNTIYEVQLQKSIVLRMQPQYEATLTQPLQCDPQRLNNKHNRTTRNGVGN